MTQHTRYKSIEEPILSKIKEELATLDRDSIPVNGKNLKASQCYHFGTNPLHVLFNTNCPKSLKEKIQSIIAKYVTHNESGAQ